MTDVDYISKLREVLGAQPEETALEAAERLMHELRRQKSCRVCGHYFGPCDLVERGRDDQLYCRLSCVAFAETEGLPCRTCGSADMGVGFTCDRWPNGLWTREPLDCRAERQRLEAAAS